MLNGIFGDIMSNIEFDGVNLSDVDLTDALQKLLELHAEKLRVRYCW